jgi:hypothetical protein
VRPENGGTKEDGTSLQGRAVSLRSKLAVGVMLMSYCYTHGNVSSAHPAKQSEYGHSLQDKVDHRESKMKV